MTDQEAKRPWETTRQALAAALADIDGVLPGSVVTLHGPYIQWTRTVDGKTVTRYLSQTQLAHYQPWFDNARRLKDLLAKLEIASIHAVEASEQLARTATPTPPAVPPTRRARRPTAT